jgi:hypothetical protein
MSLSQAPQLLARVALDMATELATMNGRIQHHIVFQRLGEIVPYARLAGESVRGSNQKAQK